MKILMVTPTFHPIKGGAEEVVKDLSIGLNKIGISTDVMTFNINRKWTSVCKGKIEKIYGLRVFKIAALNWIPMTHSDRITLRINLIPGRFRNTFQEYDIIHFHDGGDFSFPFFSLFVRKPKILHLHGFLDFYKRNVVCRYILKNVAEIYIPISHLIESELVELGIPKYKIRYLPNGININIFRPSRMKEDNLILFVGRIEPIKGLHVLLKSIRYLKKPIHLAIIGPPSWNSAYFNNISTIIDKMQEKTVHTITYLGALEREEIIKWYQKASVLVRPDLYGVSGGLTSLEALACGTPVIGTGNDVIKDDVNGILVPPNDAVELAEGIQYLLDNEDVRKKFGEEGRRWVMENLSSEVIVERLSQIYKELIQ